MKSIVVLARDLLKTRKILTTRSIATKSAGPLHRQPCKLAVFDTADLSENHLHDLTIGNFRETFRVLKDEGIKIAICTSDDREHTLRKIRSSGLADFIDITKCDQDPALLPKPHSSNIDSICADTGVRPANIIIVGGKPVDIQLGKNAEVGLTVAIKNTETCNSNLEADETITKLEDVISILRGPVNSSKSRVQVAS